MTYENGPENYKDRLLRIQKMSPAQRALLAQKGTISERKILARDSNVEVLLALVTCSKITEQEIERIAGVAATPEVVLKAIYTSVKWLKNPRIKLACLKNPRLPPNVASKLLAGFSKQQLRNISKDPVVPVKTRELVKRLLSTR